MMRDVLDLAGRILMALLFLGGAVQKWTDPGPVAAMVGSVGMPTATVPWIAGFDLLAALGLVFGPGVTIWALVMAGYCMATSWFHWQLRADPWQVTIFVKNWAIAGGLMVLAAQGPGRWALRLGRRPERRRSGREPGVETETPGPASPVGAGD